jgi:hypothetical protein
MYLTIIHITIIVSSSIPFTMSYTIAFLSLLAAAKAQQVGTDTAENHPAMTWSDCTSGTCQQVQGEVVIDANWRWVHNGGYTSVGDDPKCAIRLLTLVVTYSRWL